MTQMPSYRELRRSQTDRKISGVCGGVAEYLNVDPTVIRLAAVALTIITGGAFIIAYVVAMVVMPESPKPGPVWNYPSDQNGQPGQPGQPAQPGQPGQPGRPGWDGRTPQGEPFPGYPGAATRPADTPHDK
jgi:phage shock protein PspC (stress-responsive transcriptional regulator)